MEEIKIKEIFNIIWEKKILIIVITIAFAIAGAVYTLAFKTPIYTAYTRIVLVMTGNDNKKESKNETSGGSITTSDIALNSQLVSTYSEIAKSNNVIREVISNLGINATEGGIRSNLSITSVEDTEVIKIQVTNANAVYASKIANEIAKVFSKRVKEIYKIDNIYTLDEAETPSGPSNINHTKDVLLFMIIGMIISLTYVFIVSMLDNTVKTVEDIEKGFDVPVLITVPLIENFDDIDEEGK